MKPVYSDLIAQQTIHTAGVWKVQITPREWLASDPVIDYETGVVLTTVSLKSNKFWMLISMTDASYDFEEAPQSAKSGTFYQISIGGVLNTFNPPLQQVLETLRFSEMVAIVYDRNKRRKLVGNTNAAMKMTVSHSHKNSPAGVESLQLNFTGQFECPAPYYNPDNTPDVSGNYLIDTNENYLLIE